jgi:hypothetical protein
MQRLLIGALAGATSLMMAPAAGHSTGVVVTAGPVGAPAGEPCRTWTQDQVSASRGRAAGEAWVEGFASAYGMFAGPHATGQVIKAEAVIADIGAYCVAHPDDRLWLAATRVVKAQPEAPR